MVLCLSLNLHIKLFYYAVFVTLSTALTIIYYSPV